MREIVLDTETTGLDPANGDRVVEIGCVETMHHIATGESFHVYINPERDMPQEAFNVHGLSEEFLSDKPVFAEIIGDFMAFIGDAPLVIHNAEFDMRFLNAEFKKLGRPLLPRERAIDTVAMARRKFPGAQANLDALCRRFEIDLSRRDKHGALLDAELLADVYLLYEALYRFVYPSQQYSLRVLAQQRALDYYVLLGDGRRRRHRPQLLPTHEDERP